MINVLKKITRNIDCPFKLGSVMIHILFGLIILLGFYIVVKMNLTGRSLWYDEAALAVSISQRDIGSLTSSGLDHCQSAPVIWLYLVKIVILVFGNNEFTLRIWSLLSYVGIVFCSIYMFKKIFNIKVPIGAAAFISMIPFFVRYSNVFKPYEFDGLCVLLVIIIYYLYHVDKISFIMVGVSWAVLIWCSNPTCFFEGGMLMAGFLEAIFQKKWKKCRNIVFIGTQIIVSFIIYYFYWLRQSVGYMQDFWDGSQFPLIPTSIYDIKMMIADVKYIYSAFENIHLFVFALSIVSFVGCIIKKDHILIGIYFGFIVTLFASYLGLFPIADRLWVFSYPLIGILAMVGLDYFCHFVSTNISRNAKRYRYLCFSLEMFFIFLLIIFGRGWRYLYTFNHYWLREEINYELEYIQNNIKDDESIFVFRNAFLGYQYKTEYGNKQLFTNEVYMSTSDYKEDASIISNIEKCYIVSTHYDINEPEEPCNMMIQLLRKSGYVQLVAYDHMTPVYYYCKNEEDIKSEVNPEEVWY